MDPLEVLKKLKEISSLKENQTCVDCQDNTNIVTHLTVNNGVFLCKDCAEKHQKQLLPMYSLVRPLDSDYWSQEQIATLEAGGGNKKFIEFMHNYELDAPETNLSDKYMCHAASFWRDNLHAISNGLVQEGQIPTKMVGCAILDQQVEGDWTLVDKSQVACIQRSEERKSGEIVDNNEFESKNQFLDNEEDLAEQQAAYESQIENETLRKMSIFFKKQGDSLNKSIHEAQLKEKTKAGWDTVSTSVVDGSKKAGQKISETYTEIIESETTKSAIKSTKRGWGRFSKKIKSLFGSP